MTTEELMLFNCGVGEDLRVTWTTRRSNQSILKEISPEYSLEGLMLKLKLQYFGHLMSRADSLEKPLMLGKIESRRKRGRLRMRWLDGSVFTKLLPAPKHTFPKGGEKHFRDSWNLVRTY